MKHLYKYFILLQCIVFCGLIHGQESQHVHSHNEEILDKYAFIEVYLENEQTGHNLQSLELDIDHVHSNKKGNIEFFLTHNELEILNEAGINHRVIIPDYKKYYLEQRRLDADKMTTPVRSPQVASHFGLGSMGGFYTYDEISAKLDEMSADFPNLATPKFSIGTTGEGRNIWAVKLSDNPNVNESATEEAVHFDALHHSNEPTSMAVTMNFAFWLLENYGTNPEVAFVLNNREIYIIPCVNPDGYEYNWQTSPEGGGLWRKNRNVNDGNCLGVDLNRNYATNVSDDLINICSRPEFCSNTYRGEFPFSEPETQAIKDLIAETQPKTAFSTHAAGGKYLMPYGYEFVPSNYPLYSEWAADFASENDYIHAVTYNAFSYLSCGTTRGYMHNEGTYAWTPEIGGAKWPMPTEIFPVVAENVNPMLYQTLIAGQYSQVENVKVLSGHVTPGGSFMLKIGVKNKGVGNSSSYAFVSITSDHPGIEQATFAYYLPLAPQEISIKNIMMTADANIPCGTAKLFVEVKQNGIVLDTEEIEVIVGDRNDIFIDDAEAGTGNWTIENVGGGLNWTTTQNSAYTGSSSFVDSKGGNTNPSTSNTFTLNNALNLANTENPTLEFFTKWSMDNSDTANLEISTNGGASWTVLKDFTGVEPWHQEILDLSDYKSANTKFRFTITTGPFVDADGISFDDFRVSDYSCFDDCAYDVIESENFEQSIGNWVDGGQYCRRSILDNAYANGQYCVRLVGKHFSSILTSENMDLIIYDEVQFDFSYITASMEASEDFWLQISTDGGNTFSTVEAFASGVDFQNGVRENPSITISGPFTTNTKFRFRCDASGSGDFVYLDDVHIEGCFTSCPIVGDACDDGNSCTDGTIYDENCECTGGELVVDVNNNNICDLDESCYYVTTDFEDFEGGWGLWNDGGSDCRRSANDAQYANSGSYCVRLRDNTASSTMTTDNIDLSWSIEVEVHFSYTTISMETAEDFWLQVSTDGGASFTTVATYRKGYEFQNNERKNEVVVVPGPFSTNTKFRFRCDASGNYDWVYIDDILIKDCTISNDIIDSEIETRSSRSSEEFSFDYFPNPTTGDLYIYPTNKKMDKEQVFTLYNIQGVKVSEQTLSPSVDGHYKIDLNGINNGIYILAFVHNNKLYKNKIIKTE